MKPIEKFLRRHFLNSYDDSNVLIKTVAQYNLQVPKVLHNIHGVPKNMEIQ